MMITKEQIEAAEHGDTIRVQGNVELVLIRADIYDTLTNSLDPQTPTRR